MRLIWSYLKHYPRLILLNLLGGVFFMVLVLGVPTLFARIINEAIMVGDRDLFWKYLIWMVSLIMVAGIGRMLLAFASSKLTNIMVQKMRNDLYARSQNFSHQEFEKIGVASLVTRLSNDAFILLQFTEMSLRLGVNAPLMFLGSVAIVLMTYPSQAWVMGLALVLIIIMIYFTAVRAKPISSAQQTSLDQINQYARENLTGLRVIRAFTREDYRTQVFGQEANQYASLSKKLFVLMGFSTPGFYHISMWAMLLVIILSLRPIESGQMLVGDLVAFIEYLFHALFSFLLFSQLFLMYPRMSVSAARLQEIIDIPISIDPNEGGVAQTATQGYIEFQNVTFAYPGDGATESPVLHNISFKASPGQTVAFIGSTGSGKSTLVQLIPRFYDVTLGKILIDGVDVRDYQLKALRQKIGFIPQKSLLFTGTIGENLRYGKADASEQELDQASEIAQARQFIDQHQERFDTFLSEGGSNLSGGQKQRLSIARAIVKEPTIYIFDDSFSALDYQTDAALRKALKEQTQDKTVIIVAQRISSIKDADLIVVLEDGEVVGQGRHEDLLANNTIYQEIAQSQGNYAEAESLPAKEPVADSTESEG